MTTQRISAAALQKRCTVVAFLILSALLAAGCIGLPGGGPAALEGELCADPWAAVEAFYAANDAGDFDAALDLLSDDPALIAWAQGANGYHMSAHFAVGKGQIRERLGDDGLRIAVNHPERPNFSIQDRQAEGNTLRFELLPDRLRPDGRPFNHFAVEMVFKGCKIDIIKLVERVTWL